jgi:putative phosphoribosyl transferase
VKLRHYPFLDRLDAGRQLADVLAARKFDQPVVLALPRGGVPVAWKIAQVLNAPLDVLLVRKIPAPMYPELALGAIISHPHFCRVLNKDLMRMLKPSTAYLEAEEKRQLDEIARRRECYCGDRPPVPVKEATVIIVDDGVATGATLKTALHALADADTKQLLFAVPVAPPTVLDDLRQDADEGICLLPAANFKAVSQYYANFEQTSDEEVIDLLHRST